MTRRSRAGAASALVLASALTLGLGLGARAQINSGSNGSDGALNPSTNIVINMADHPNGIYQYTSVNIPSGVTVTFIPNATNSPVTWLVQSNCVINGTVNVSGPFLNSYIGTNGGPGGWGGGSGGSIPTPGQGPGGGGVGIIDVSYPQGGSFATLGGNNTNSRALYGNSFLLPLLGGSGGGAAANANGGSGGGAILIAASDVIQLNGSILANGASSPGEGGGGSGGAVRLVTQTFTGSGAISVTGGANYGAGGSGWIRIDALAYNDAVTFSGVVSQGYQPIIIPTPGQGMQLTITSIGGVPVPANPAGILATPDAILSAQQTNPIPVVVSCSNVPLNSSIIVTVVPQSGASVSAVANNNTGSLASSTATASLVFPRGGGLIYASVAVGN